LFKEKQFMKSFASTLCLFIGTIALCGFAPTFDLDPVQASAMHGAGPQQQPQPGVPDAKCIDDSACETSGDDCDNSWGTECLAHGLDWQVAFGKGCGVQDETICRLNAQLWPCKLTLKCVFDEDENCVVGEQVQGFSRPLFCFDAPM
jgi:hypothetical protein